MGIKNKNIGIAIIVVLTLFSGNSGAAAAGTPGLKLSVGQSQQDSPQKPPDRDNPTPAGQEKPAQEQSAPSKPEQKPETPPPPAEKQNPSKSTPTEPAHPAPEPGSAPSASQAAAPNSAPPAGAPEAESGAAGTEPPAGSAPNAKSSSSANGPHHKNEHSNSRKKIVVREGGTAEANALLAPSMTSEQALRQKENTLHLLASADANLQKLSGRQWNMNQQAMIDQARAYIQQSKDALDRGDLQRSHNLALKASLLTDDLARH